MSKVSIHDVAKAAGLSAATVSRVLNDAPTYTHGADAQRRVREAADRLGYEINTAARLLKQRKKTLVGLSTHFSEHPFVNRFLVAARDELLQHEYEPIVMEPAHMVLSSDGEKKAPRHIFPSTDLLLGVLSFGYGVSDEGSAYCLELSRKVPVVAMVPLLNDEVNWIYSDDGRGIEMLVDHLVSLGHRRIAFALSSKSIYHGEHLKLEGWEKAVEKYRLEESACLIELDDRDDIKARAAAIEKALLAMEPRPTALMCSGDESALRVMALLHKRGWDIPRDLSITGYDGIAFSEYVHPELTTILQPVEEVARLAVKRLLELVENPSARQPRQTLLEPKLLARGSTAPPRQA